MICKNCNKEFSEDMNFCPYCGTEKIIEELTAPQHEISTCPNCGTELSEAMAFCPNCGTGNNSIITTEQGIETVSMFCKNCGVELPQGTIFCPHCGTNQSVPIQKKLRFINDGKMMLKGFFSKSPFSTVEKALEEKSLMVFGIIYLVLNILLFAFVSCHTLSQTLNYLISRTGDLIGTLIDSASGGLLSDLISTASLNVSPFYDLLLPFILIGIVVFIIEFAGIYLLLTVLKCKPESVSMVVNAIAVSSLPIAPALIISFLIGFVFSPLSFCIFVTAFIVHVIMLCKSIQIFKKSDDLPMWGFTIAFFIANSLVTIIIVNSIMKLLGSLFSDFGGSIFDDFLSLFSL